MIIIIIRKTSPEKVAVRQLVAGRAVGLDSPPIPSPRTHKSACYWLWRQGERYVVSCSLGDTKCFSLSSMSPFEMTLQFCGFCSNRILLYFLHSVRMVSQTWHLNFFPVFENHIFSESISSSMATLTTLTTWHPGLPGPPGPPWPIKPLWPLW